MSIESDVGEITTTFFDAVEGTYTEDASVKLAVLFVAVDQGNGTVTYHQHFGPGNPSVHEGMGLVSYCLERVKAQAQGLGGGAPEA